MNIKLVVKYLFTDSRALVYLSWAILTGIGFTATHFRQEKSINILWVIISVLGLGFMVWKMPLRDRQMRKIFLVWFITIVFGMIVSGLAFYIPALQKRTQDLGIFWLVIMAYGYLANAYVDNPPRTWYYVAFVVNILAAVACLTISSFQDLQYIVAAVVSVYSMLSLWLLRSMD